MTQSARVDIVSNDAGELVRRERARDLGASVVQAIHRLAKLAQLHDLNNQAFLRQLEQTHATIQDYILKAGTNVNVLFAHRAVFVAGQLLKGSRATYDNAHELGEILAWCGGSDLTITREVTSQQLHQLAEAISLAMRSGKGTFRLSAPAIRLRTVSDAARLRGLEVERLPFDQRVVRVYASAVVIMRRLLEDIELGRYALPQRVKRVAQNIVDLSEGSAAAFLGVTEMRNAASDDAGRAVNGAILAVLVARQLTKERTVLAEIAMAALVYDVGRPRAIAHAKRGMPQLRVRLGEDEEDRLPAGTAAVLTALGRLNEASIRRTVAAYESLWMRRAQFLGPVYRGARQPTVHARIIAIARRYNDFMTPDPGLPPPAPDHAIARLSAELEGGDLTALRLLVAALGIIPVGTVLQLQTGEVVEVVRSRGNRPVVRVVMDARGAVVAQHQEIDLDTTQAKIARVLGTDGWRKGEGSVQDASIAPREPSHPSRSRSTSGVSQVSTATPSFGTSPSAVAQAVPSRRIVPSAPPPPVVTEAPPSSRHPPPSGSMSTIVTNEDGRTVLAPSPFQDSEHASATAVGIVGSTPVVHILVYVLDHGLSGTVELTEQGGEKHFIYFEHGAPTKVKTSRDIAQLAKELVHAGLISDARAALAITEAKARGLLLGEYLVQTGQVAPEHVDWVLALQMRRKLAMVVNLPPNTRYAFYKDRNLVQDWGGAGAHVEPLGTILAAARAWHDRVRIRATLQRIAGQVLLLHPESTVHSIDMAPEEQQVLMLMQEHQLTVADMFRVRGIDEEALASLVYALAVTRHLVLPGQRGGPMGLTHVRAPSQPVRTPSEQARAVMMAPPTTPTAFTPMAAPETPTPPPPSPQPPPPQSSSPPAPAVAPPATAVSAKSSEVARELKNAEIALSKKELPNAEAAARRAVKIDPDHVEANALLEWVLVMQGKKPNEAAIQALSDLLRRDAACVRARVSRAKLLKRENKIPQAIEDFEEALRVDPENKEAKNELQLLRLFARR